MSNEALAGAIFVATLRNSAVASLAMPLEQGVFSQIFGDATTGLSRRQAFERQDIHAGDRRAPVW